MVTDVRQASRDEWLADYTGIPRKEIKMNITDQLKRPFPVNQLKWRKGPGGKELVYIDARQFQHRLDDVFGMDWQCRFTHVTDGGVVCEVGLFVDGEWRWRANGAGKTGIEGDKGQFSDAFKRACVMWGIGKYLYELKDKNNIPKWATPEGFDEIINNREESNSE